MRMKITISIIYLVILLAITIYIASCINYLSEIYKCYDNNTLVYDLTISQKTINVFFWLYIAIEFIVTLCLGTLIGLNISNGEKNQGIIKLASSFTIFVNIIKIVLFVIVIILYRKCISNLPEVEIYLFIFFSIDVVVIGMSECIVSCFLLPNEKTEIPKNYHNKYDKNYKNRSDNRDDQNNYNTCLFNDYNEDFDEDFDSNTPINKTQKNRNVEHYRYSPQNYTNYGTNKKNIIDEQNINNKVDTETVRPSVYLPNTISNIPINNSTETASNTNNNISNTNSMIEITNDEK